MLLLGMISYTLESRAKLEDLPRVIFVKDRTSFCMYLSRSAEKIPSHIIHPPPSII